MEVKDIAGRIIAYLRLNNVSNVEKEINSSTLAKEWGCHRGEVWAYRECLAESGVITKVGVVRRVGTPSGIYRLEPEYIDGEIWREKLQFVYRSYFTKKNKQKKFSTSQRLWASQKLAIRLEDEVRSLRITIKNLRTELDNERLFHARDANDIATLELRLREARSQVAYHEQHITKNDKNPPQFAPR